MLNYVETVLVSMFTGITAKVPRELLQTKATADNFLGKAYSKNTLHKYRTVPVARLQQ